MSQKSQQQLPYFNLCTLILSHPSCRFHESFYVDFDAMPCKIYFVQDYIFKLSIIKFWSIIMIFLYSVRYWGLQLVTNKPKRV
jgi:hypothetical protein